MFNKRKSENLKPIFLTAFANDCSRREYEPGYIVCVCNTTYCDSLKPFSLKPATAVIIESSKSGKRFAKSEISFKDESEFKKSKRRTSYIDVTINREKRYQSIIGFGGAFTDSAGLNIQSLPKTLSERLIKDYFAEDGVQYSIGRITIAVTDFSTRKYAYNEVDGDFNLTHFKLTEEDIKLKIPIIKYAMNVSTHKLKLFSSDSSSPAWMKTNNDIAGGGILKGRNNFK
ncbi:glucosylceramidase-like protein [Leptotrombidium deliense]|uniref:Glucosylceramidase n=1 Tax=Leptotrombidium deliense TaxID=299467 RepID=A0A443S0J8_9ACAR|nr:glucosylceramidase-like protein [Leptotrombidium deliense]